MGIEFKDFTMEISSRLEQSMLAAAAEAGGELRDKTKRYSRVSKISPAGKTKGSYRYEMLPGSGSVTVVVGSSEKNAIWEEFGTGEHALHDDGRKGGWVYKDPKTGNFYYTTGKEPNQPMTRAYEATKGKIIKRVKSVLKDVGGG